MNDEAPEQKLGAEAWLALHQYSDSRPHPAPAIASLMEGYVDYLSCVDPPAAPDEKDAALVHALCNWWYSSVRHRFAVEARLLSALATVRAEERSACIDAIKSLRAVPRGLAYNNAINDAIHKVESLTIQE